MNKHHIMKNQRENNNYFLQNRWKQNVVFASYVVNLCSNLQVYAKCSGPICKM